MAKQQTYWATLSPQQRKDIQNTVKRVNEAYADIVRNIGKKGALAKQYEGKITKFSNIPTTKINGRTVEDFPRTSKGILKIAKPSTFTEQDVKLLRQMDKFTRLGARRKQITQEYKEQGVKYKKDKDGLISYKELKQYETKSYDVHQIIIRNKEALYNASTELTIAVRRSSNLTIEEMNDLITLYKNKFKVDETEQADTENMTEQEAENYAKTVLDKIKFK